MPLPRPLRALPILLLALARCAPVDVLNATTSESGITVTRDVPFGPRLDQKLDIYRPEGASGLPVLVFFYGGSWRQGSRGMYPFLAASLARRGMVVVVPDYRLYPQVRFPEFLDDCAQAAAWVAQHQTSLGGGGGLFLMGHSAGAYNAVMLGLDRQWMTRAGSSPDALSGVIGLAGPYDFLPITKEDIKPVFPDAGPQTQPISFARGDGPPLLLITGTADTEVKPRNTAALAARVQAAGGSVQTITYPGLGHLLLVGAFAPLLHWRAPVLRDVVTFVHDTASRREASHPVTPVAKPAAVLP